MTRKTGLALIGAGYVSYFHLFAARDLPSMRAVAVASQSKRNAEHRARIFGLEAYGFGDLEAMVGRDDVELAIVASPNALHYEHAMTVVRAGCHVVLEKPMVLRLGEGERLIAAAEGAGVFVGYAENHVFSPLLVRMRQEIAKGTIGGVRRIRGAFHHGGPARGTWWYRKEFSGGGAQVDLGSHVIEGCLFLAGRPRVDCVRSCRMDVDPADGLDKRAVCELETREGILIETESSWMLPEMRCVYEAEGTEGALIGTFDLGLEPHRLLRRGPEGREETVSVPDRFDFRVDELIAKGGYTAQLAHFEECLRNGTRPAESGQDGWGVLKIIAASYLAAAANRPVDLSEEIPQDRTPIEFLEP
jgi:predicted dehydrogenase